VPRTVRHDLISVYGGALAGFAGVRKEKVEQRPGPVNTKAAEEPGTPKSQIGRSVDGISPIRTPDKLHWNSTSEGRGDVMSVPVSEELLSVARVVAPQQGTFSVTSANCCA
jgi:hypothetical protein